MLGHNYKNLNWETQNLNWETHVDKIVKRFIVVCHLVKRLHTLNIDVLLKVYYGCFHSVMAYELIVSGNSPRSYQSISASRRVIRKMCRL